MARMGGKRLLNWAVVLACSLGSRAAALDLYEVQVYDGSINRPREIGLEVHLNGTLSGRTEAAYLHEIPPHQAFRMTLEPAIGVTEWFEAGAYLQHQIVPGYGLRYAGFKLRGKFVIPTRLTGNFVVGLNIEIGKFPREVEEDEWGTELRPILGWRNDRFLLVVNPMLGWSLAGPRLLGAQPRLRTRSHRRHGQPVAPQGDCEEVVVAGLNNSGRRPSNSCRAFCGSRAFVPTRSQHSWDGKELSCARRFD
jgi:hypothetical protein